MSSVSGTARQHDVQRDSAYVLGAPIVGAAISGDALTSGRITLVALGGGGWLVWRQLARWVNRSSNEARSNTAIDLSS